MYKDIKPRLAKAMDEWPLGKLFNPSLIMLISPVQSVKYGLPSPFGKHL